MLHLYIEQSLQGNEYTISDKEKLHHLGVVCRARPGDQVSMFNPAGDIYRGTIIAITGHEINIKIESRELWEPARVSLTLACALPKGSGMDDIIDTLTQLGVDDIIPMLTERVVARPDDPTKKMRRWQKIAVSAAEQSQRPNLPHIHPLSSLSDVIQRTADYDLRLIPTLDGQTRPLNSVLEGFTVGRIIALIGPEGDFAPPEVQKALTAGFLAVSLGHNVLRVNTAAAAVSAFIRLLAPA